MALVDHNSGLNAPAWREACRQAGLGCLFGLEVSTREEAHLLAIFDTPEAAAELTARVYEALPARLNRPDIFGDQPVVNAHGEVERLETRLLGAPCGLSLPELRDAVHARDGLFIAAHVDRPVFSVFSQLGVLSGDEGFDACEISAHADAARWRERTGACPLVRSSDAHYLCDIGRAWCEADLSAWSVAELRTALRQGRIRLSPPA